MKLNVISDLHIIPHNYIGRMRNEWDPFEPEKLEPADYLIVAGDMGVGENYGYIIKAIRIRTRGKFKDVLWIKGNHDYWVFKNLPSSPRNHKFEVVDGDCAIFGTTMWCPVTSPSGEYIVPMRMNDYVYIPRWDIDVMRSRYKDELSWIRSKMDEHRKAGRKIILVTHHNPRRLYQLRHMSKSVEPSGIDCAYYVDDDSCDDIKPDVWITGHDHARVDIIDDGVRYFRNPIGYHGVWYGPVPQLSEKHWYDSVIEV